MKTREEIEAELMNELSMISDDISQHKALKADTSFCTADEQPFERKPARVCLD